MLRETNKLERARYIITQSFQHLSQKTLIVFLHCSRNSPPKREFITAIQRLSLSYYMVAFTRIWQPNIMHITMWKYKIQFSCTTPNTDRCGLLADWLIRPDPCRILEAREADPSLTAAAVPATFARCRTETVWHPNWSDAVNTRGLGLVDRRPLRLGFRQNIRLDSREICRPCMTLCIDRVLLDSDRLIQLMRWL